MIVLSGLQAKIHGYAPGYSDKIWRGGYYGKYINFWGIYATIVSFMVIYLIVYSQGVFVQLLGFAGCQCKYVKLGVGIWACVQVIVIGLGFKNFDGFSCVDDWTQICSEAGLGFVTCQRNKPGQVAF